jgi:tetratricopeptide (TPR) repeat protein
MKKVFMYAVLGLLLLAAGGLLVCVSFYGLFGARSGEDSGILAIFMGAIIGVGIVIFGYYTERQKPGILIVILYYLISGLLPGIVIRAGWALLFKALKLIEELDSKAAGKELFMTHLAWLIFAPFAVLSLLILFFFYHDFQLSSNRSAILNAERERRWEDAIPHLRKMLEIDKGNEIEWNRRLGWAYINIGDYQPGIEHLETAKKLNPKLNLAEGRMICYYELSRATENPEERDELIVQGREYRDRVLKDNPNNPAANYYLAIEKIGAGDDKGAGLALRAAALEPLWDERAAPLRQKLAERAFTDDGAQTILAAVPETAPQTPPKPEPDAAPITTPTAAADAPTTATAR